MQRLINPVVLAFCACAVLVGCASQPVTHAIPAQVAVNDDRPDYDDQTIYDYQSLYRYIAANELPKAGYVGEITPEHLLKFAADSHLEIHRVEMIPIQGIPTKNSLIESIPTFLYAIEAHYNKHFQDQSEEFIADSVRGVSGNGSFYFFVPVKSSSEAENRYEDHFRLVGIAYGNSYKLEYSNSVPQIVAHWHMSAREMSESVHVWNGERFRLASKKVITEQL